MFNKQITSFSEFDRKRRFGFLVFCVPMHLVLWGYGRFSTRLEFIQRPTGQFRVASAPVEFGKDCGRQAALNYNKGRKFVANSARARSVAGHSKSVETVKTV
jgi:hypothetical protein